MRDRAAELIGQLASQLPIASPNLPDIGQVAANVLATFRLADVVRLRPYLVAEVSVWSSDEQALLAGRADALIVESDTVLGVLDWKSDVAPSVETKSLYLDQIREYLNVTGAIAGAIVFITTGELIWIGDRKALFDRLVG